ncbi:MAG: methyltransferase domain-containing protein [Desulfurococcaceae archaeon]
MPERKSLELNEGSVTKERGSEEYIDWWKTYFTKEWLLLEPMKSGVKAARFIADILRIPQGSRILDLGCGYGRISIELAKLGYNVIGFDYSYDLLKIAEESAKKQGVRVEFVRGDMRELPYQNEFDAVVSWDTSFGYFTDDENEHVIHLISRSLKEGGRLVLDLHNRDAYIRKYLGVKEEDFGDYRVHSEWTFEVLTSRLVIKELLIDLRTGLTKTYMSFIREYTIPEMSRMLRSAGLRIIKFYGDCSDRFDLESDSVQILAEKNK